MKLTREEQETIIRANALDQEWDVFTEDPRMIRYLTKQGYKLEHDYQISDGWMCMVPFRKLRISRREVKRSAKQIATSAKLAKLTGKRRSSAEDES